MTTVRHSVEKTIARLARRVLVERAQAAGTASARADAPAALAALIEQRLTNPALGDEELEDWCQVALGAGFGSVAVPARRVAPVAELLTGSKIYLTGLSTADDLADPESALNHIIAQGAQEIEVALSDHLCVNLARLEDALQRWIGICQQHKTSLNIQLPVELLGREECAAVCRLLARAEIDGLGLRIHAGVADQLGQLRQLVGTDMGLYVIGRIESLELARQLLAAGATRLSTSAGLSLLESTRQPSAASHPEP